VLSCDGVVAACRPCLRTSGYFGGSSVIGPFRSANVWSMMWPSVRISSRWMMPSDWLTQTLNQAGTSGRTKAMISDGTPSTLSLRARAATLVAGGGLDPTRVSGPRPSVDATPSRKPLLDPFRRFVPIARIAPTECTARRLQIPLVNDGVGKLLRHVPFVAHAVTKASALRLVDAVAVRSAHRG